MNDLNATERRVLLLLTEGHNDADLIAEVLDIEPEEVEMHIDRIVRLGYIDAHTVH